MKLPVLALKNSYFIHVILLIVLFVGFLTWRSMPRSEDPFMELPLYTIVAVHPGNSPGEVEKFIVDPIEEALEEVSELTEIRSEITSGLAVIKVEAEYGIDYREKYDEILSEVNRIRENLPEEMYELKVIRYQPEERSVIHQYAIVSASKGYPELHDIAKEFQKEIEELSLVKKTEILAFPEEEIRVDINFEKMVAYGISIDEIIGVLKAYNAYIPGGELISGNLSLNLKTSGALETLAEIEEIPFFLGSNHPVQLGDMAEVRKSLERPRWVARIKGEPCIFLTVHQKKNANVLHLESDLEEILSHYQEELPKGVRIETAFEQAPAVDNRLTDFMINLLQGIFLVGIVIWLFLGIRSGVIVMTVVPLSILLAIILLDYSGYALQQISIAALVIALGLLVDNAIVVIESIGRYQGEGFSRKEAVVRGTSEVGYAVISSTFTTILAFIPLVFLESGPGEYLRSLPLTVIYALLASLLLALGFTPLISGKLLKKEPESSTWMLKRVIYFTERYYRRILHFSLGKGYIILGISLLLFMGSLSLFPAIGVSLFPTADKNLLLISVDLPYSSNLENTDKAVRYVEDILDTTGYVSSYTSNTGHGNPQVYYNRTPKEYRLNHGEILVNFKKWDPVLFYRTLESLRMAFRRYPEARIHFEDLKNGSPFEAPVEVIILGEDLDTLKHIASDIEKEFYQTEGLLDINNPLARTKTGLELVIDAKKAALYNLTTLEVDRMVRARTEGLYVDEINLIEYDEPLPLMIGGVGTGRANPQELDGLFIPGRSGKQIPLKQISKLNFRGEIPEIRHYNNERAVSITASVTDSDQTRNITESLIAQLERYDFPPGYDYKIGGEYETQQQSFGNLGVLLLLALAGIFAVLVFQFKSFVQPVIIFTAIPLAVSGSLIALYFSGWSFSFFAFVGLISLVGIVVNNSIILVDYINKSRNGGMDRLTAIEQAALRRFTPILLTTFTTILGLVPLTASGTSLWSPLGWTLIGGLISSMCLTLLVVPVLYKWMSR
ncbi:efflux RND transporter permease subunit [Zunongwangia sp. F363]|uniref:Efflux RND transporter permease subunit n=1 Tax=Autumnicola tepida TaxID=3075595 RepID=A0ABU3CEP3_9FLAO|nr:efflux RND transporter permease subunit [Zunongwangia sp. F363]MDT0644826.1 efflux RND transporter permease subunit [Zunongwangia sp. F363]